MAADSDAQSGGTKAMRQRAPEVNLFDMPELMPGARPSANPAQREEFEQRCRKLHRDAEKEEQQAATATHVAAGGTAKPTDLEAMFPALDAALVRAICADSPSPQHAIDTLLALTAATSEPVAGGGTPARAATPPPRNLGVEDHEKFPSLVDRDGWQVANTRDFEREEEDLGSKWRDRAKAVADLPAPKVTAATTAAAGAWSRRRRQESGEEGAAASAFGAEGEEQETALPETDYEFRHRVGERRAKTRALYGRGGARGGGRGGPSGVSAGRCCGEANDDAGEESEEDLLAAN